MVRLSFAVALILLVQGCVGISGLNGLRVVVIDGRQTLLGRDDIDVVRRGDTLYIRSPGEDVYANGHCQVEMNGFSEARITSIVADRVSIFMDGNSTLEIESLTSSKIVTEAAGLSRVSMIEPESR